MRNWLPFEVIAALRFLREGRMQTIFIVSGVSIGVAVIVFMAVMLAGMQANFIRRVLSAQAHVVLLPLPEAARPLRGGEPGSAEAATVQKPLQRVRSIDQWQRILRDVARMPQVRAVSPMAAGPVLAARGDASRAVTLLGVDPEAYFRIVPLPDYLVAGELRLASTDIAIGIELASDLGLVVGDKLRVSAANGGSAVLTVAGIVDLGSKPANQRNTYAALHTAQALLGMVGGVSSIDVKIRDIYAAEDVAQEIGRATGVEADSWIRTNAQFFSAVQAQTTANIAVRVFVALSVAFGIASVLVVSVVQRSREIGILRAMGTSSAQVMRVFLVQGGLYGLVGSLVGSALGAAAVLAWRATMRGADGSPLIPVVLEPGLFIETALLATITGVVAAAAPALRGARLDPVEAIRG